MSRPSIEAPAPGAMPAAVVLSENVRAVPAASLNEAAPALTRSLGRRGVHVIRLHPDRLLADARSRYCSHERGPNLRDDPYAVLDAHAPRVRDAVGAVKAIRRAVDKLVLTDGMPMQGDVFTREPVVSDSTDSALRVQSPEDPFEAVS